MKKFTRHLSLVLTAVVTAATVSLALSAWATTNGYNYLDPRGCHDEPTCTETDSSSWYCKQLTIPFVDPGCCQYWRTVIYWGSIKGICSCASATPTIEISSAVHTPGATCTLPGGASAPVNTDVQGTCVTPP